MLIGKVLAVAAAGPILYNDHVIVLLLNSNVIASVEELVSAIHNLQYLFLSNNQKYGGERDCKSTGKEPANSARDGL